MIGYVTLGTNDLPRAAAFYDALLAEIGARRLFDLERGIAWGVAMHPDGFVVAAIGGQAGGHLFFWKPDQADEFHTLNCGNSARDLSLHPDGVRLATAHHDGHVRIYKMGPK